MPGSMATVGLQTTPHEEEEVPYNIICFIRNKCRQRKNIKDREKRETDGERERDKCDGKFFSGRSIGPILHSSARPNT